MTTNTYVAKNILYSRLLPATVLGNALEFFDFTIYAIFAATIGTTFFPSNDPTISLLASWATFGVGFIMRPMGALVFGYLGDKFGRKFSLSSTVLITGIPTLCIGLLPGYEEIGVIAPLVLILCRLLQGLCTGGEYNGAAIFALEHFGKLKPGTVGGIITGSCVIGSLLATFSGFIISNYGDTWMWRVPFLFGAFISFIGFFIRYHMKETPEFISLNPKRETKKARLIEIYTSYRASSLLSFAVGALNGALSYTLFGFLNVYMAKYLGLEAAVAMKYNLLGLAFFMCFSPVAGYVLDKIGGDKTMQFAGLAVLGGAFPVFTLLQTLSTPFVLIGQAVLGMLTAGIAGAGHGFMQKLFPTEVRYRGVSFNFCLGMALGGGCTPVLMTYLIESRHMGPYTPAYYLMILSFVFLILMLSFSKREKAGSMAWGHLTSTDSLS